MQYGASSSLTHVALSCGTSTCLNTSDFAAPFLLHSLTYSTVNTMSTSSSVMRTGVCALGARDTILLSLDATLAHPALFMTLADAKAP